MKITWILWSVLLNLLLLQPVLAAASIPVAHTHSGRAHSHPLPDIGFAHRHGNGAPGIIARQSGSGSITGTLTPNAKIPAPAGSITGTLTPNARIPDTSTVFRQGTQQPGINTGIPHNSTVIRQGTRKQQIPNQTPNSPNVIRQGTGSRIFPQPTIRYDRADVRCRRGESDCNVCAVNVRQQFAQAASGRINWRTDAWHFNWNQAYPPKQTRPTEIFAGKKKYLLGIPDKHIQGFVRTNSNHYLFAGTHSHRNRGGIFLIRQNPQGEKYMAALFKTKTRHPSGVHIIGQYLAYGEGQQLHLKDLHEPSARDLSLTLPGPKANFGGGLGISRLPDGSHLLITSGPGGQDQRPRSNRFYHLQNQHGRPQRLHFINQSPQTQPPEWPAGFRYAENLSLITECGSGDIYAVHSTGDQDGIKAVRGNGYWRLSRLIQENRQLHLQPTNAFVQQQKINKCSMRAAATVHVNQRNQLEFYCHGYAKNPKGSTMNVLGKSNNKFRFQIGTPR